MVPNCCLPVSVPLDITHTRAHHLLKLAQIQSRMYIYNQSFLPRTIPTRNTLDIQDIDKIGLTTFKDNLLRS